MNFRVGDKTQPTLDYVRRHHWGRQYHGKVNSSEGISVGWVADIAPNSIYYLQEYDLEYIDNNGLDVVFRWLEENT